MNIPGIERLNDSFSLYEADTTLIFEMGEGGIPLVKIANAQATATISLQGAQILSWIPKGQDEVIWVSEAASFAPGKSVRGGVPVCWPWFGAHAAEAGFPAHGFARTSIWDVTDSRALPTGETLVVFQLDTRRLDATRQAFCPQPLLAEFRVTVGSTLNMELMTENLGEAAMTLGQALHTYFNVGDVTATTVRGLEGKAYLDKTESFARKTQQGPVGIDREVDRVYLDTAEDVVIDNGVRRIVVSKTGSRSTVVWNPWQAVAEKMGDLGPAGYLQMLCVESANAADDVVNLAPGQRHVLQVRYALEGVG